MNKIIALLVILVGALNSGHGSLQQQLLHPCLPSRPRGQTALQNVSQYPSTTPAQKQYRLHDIQLNMMEAARSTSRMQRAIKRELRKKNKRFRATFLKYQKDVKGMIKKAKKSSILKSLKKTQRGKACLQQNLKIHYTTISHIYSHLSQVPRRQEKTKHSRGWNRKLSQLQKKQLLILCRLKEVLLSERTTVPSIPESSKAVFSEDSVLSRLDLYKQLTHFKLSFKWMIRLYKYYDSMRKINTRCKGYQTRPASMKSSFSDITNPPPSKH